MVDLIEEDGSMADITVRTIGPRPNSCLRVPSTIKVKEFRRLISETNHLPIENMTLVFRGKVLQDTGIDDDLSVQLHDGETVTVAIRPKPPAKHIRESVDDLDEDDLKFQIPESASWWKRRIFCILRDKFRLPDILLTLIFVIRLKTWIVIALWFALALVARRLEFGPLYIIGTGFFIIFYNLGHRQPGDISAYSVFNEDFRELPGTLNADRLDRDLRAGRL